MQTLPIGFQVAESQAMPCARRVMATRRQCNSACDQVIALLSLAQQGDHASASLTVFQHYSVV
jgi:hypothetical protein